MKGQITWEEGNDGGIGSAWAANKSLYEKKAEGNNPTLSNKWSMHMAMTG